MNSVSGRGLVLSRRKHLEHDVRLTLLLRNEGKVIATIKGAQRFRSKLRVFQEPFTLADLHVFLPPHGLYARITQGHLINTHPGLRQNPLAFEAACRCVETVDALLPFRAPAPEPFDILVAALDALQTSVNPTVEWLLFVLRLLQALGHGDHSQDVLKWLRPDDMASVERCRIAVETQLQQILPRKLKSADIELNHA